MKDNTLSLITFVILYQMLNLVHHTQTYTSIYLNVILGFTYEIKE